MEPTGESVPSFLERVAPRKRRTDAVTMLDLMSRATGQPPLMWGTVIGFGRYHYRYASGREGDAPAAGFAPRRAATTVYLPDGVGAHEGALHRLGPHTTGVGCLYLKDLGDVDLEVLEGVVAASYRTVTAGTYPWRAREGRP
ncbi:DUF1801 domain-containing protein [Kocuria sp. M1R5S2]|uniref:DUF1801 domain-containing protein n=1 Tax=Kocuria rhizosphaerae TaxID=3376285 RepID=UPI0037A2042F